MFLLTLKCQSRELRGRVTVREENCDKTARCTFKCWIVARNEQKSRALPRKRERGADVPKWVLFSWITIDATITPVLIEQC